ncbi:MAG: ABC transporter permease [Anaerolineales bacterium]|jgi:lipopolysaccharide transport system permease protein
MQNTDNLPVVRYSSESQMRTPGKLVRSMLADVAASRELSWRLFIRDLNAQYRQSLFGVIWAFIPPIVTSLIFIVLNSRKVIDFGDVGIPYAAYVLVGTILWQMFSESLNAPLKSVTAAQQLLAKVNFPREALIISAIYLTVFNSLIKGLVIGAVIIIFRLQPGWGIIFAPLAIMMLILLGIALGLLVTPIGMLYTDVATSLPIIVQLAFFVTPVVYPPPQNFPFSLIAVLNPVSPLLIAARDLLTTGTLTNPLAVALVSGFVLLALLLGWLIYRVALPILIERMSS